MGGRARGLWPFAAIAAVVVVTVAGLYVVWRSPHRTALEGFAGLAISAAGVAAGSIAWLWRAKGRQASGVGSGPELGQLADLLAGAVDEEWTRAAGERGLLEPAPIPVRWQRPSAPFAGPAAAAAASTRFAPLPGLAAVGERRLRAGRVSDLHELYGGLGSGRLVIAGAPGSGKSGAAVLLILAALHYRQSLSESDRLKVPVPVMFTLQGWEPNTQRIKDWVAERLGQTFPLFAGKHGAPLAHGMLDEGRLAVFLDGLDEIPADLRLAVLQALTQQATFRLVLLTRSAEMAAAAAQALLQGAAAIELQDIDPATAADYLTRTQLDPPPQGWQELTSRLRQEPSSPLAQALNNPLMLTLVRDTYRTGDDTRELLEFCDAADRSISQENIVDHLLDRVLPAAYAQRPGEQGPRYSLPTAQRVLAEIARRMSRDGTRDLQWWRLAAWAPAIPRFIVGGLVAGLAIGLAAILAIQLGFILTAWFTHGPTLSLSTALPGLLTIGLVTGVVAGFAATSGGRTPRRMARVRWRKAIHPLPILLALGFGLTFGLTGGAAQGVPIGLAIGLAAGLTRAFSRPGADSTSSLSPIASWHSDRRYGLAGGITVGLAAGVAVWLTIGISTAFVFRSASGSPAAFASGLAFGLSDGLGIGLAFGLTAGLASTRAWPASLTFAQLAWRWKTPVLLMRFLEDARSRDVLRTVGPVYQFRHARLQDRLASEQPATRHNPSEPHPTAQDAAAPTTKRPHRRISPSRPSKLHDI
jgi:hypothetical protein